MSGRWTSLDPSTLSKRKRWPSSHPLRRFDGTRPCPQRSQIGVDLGNRSGPFSDARCYTLDRSPTAHPLLRKHRNCWFLKTGPTRGRSQRSLSHPRRYGDRAIWVFGSAPMKRSPHWLLSGPVAAQQCIECVGAFFGKEEPRPGEFDRWLCPRDPIGKPVGPFHRKVDVIRRPNDQGRSPQLV
jgi:hypothetical protein